MLRRFGTRRIRKKVGSSDIDFVMATYRMMLADGCHKVTIETVTSDTDRRVTTRYARPSRRTLTYAVGPTDGGDTYAMRYASPDYAFVGDRTKPVYYFEQSDEGEVRMYQGLTASSDDATLLFSTTLDHRARPLAMTAKGDDFILMMNIAITGDDDVQNTKDDAETGMIGANGFLYVIRVNVLTGQWTPLFETSKPLEYQIGALPALDGIAIANLNNKGNASTPKPRSFDELGDFMVNNTPNVAETLEIPFGVSVYEPDAGRFTVIPVGGNTMLGIADITIDDMDAKKDDAGFTNVAAIIARANSESADVDNGDTPN